MSASATTTPRSAPGSARGKNKNEQDTASTEQEAAKDVVDRISATTETSFLITRILGVCFLFAFASVLQHVEGLYGCQGILGSKLDAVFPSWLSPTTMKDIVGYALVSGLVLSILLSLLGDYELGVNGPRIILLFNTIVYAAVNAISGPMLFWKDYDNLLIEVGLLVSVLGISTADWSHCTRPALNFCLFRFLFTFFSSSTTGSQVLPLFGNDQFDRTPLVCASLWDFTWLTYSYEFPEPSSLAWYLRLDPRPVFVRYLTWFWIVSATVLLPIVALCGNSWTSKYMWVKEVALFLLAGNVLMYFVGLQASAWTPLLLIALFISIGCRLDNRNVGRTYHWLRLPREVVKNWGCLDEEAFAQQVEIASKIASGSSGSGATGTGSNSEGEGVQQALENKKNTTLLNKRKNNEQEKLADYDEEGEVKSVSLHFDNEQVEYSWAEMRHIFLAVVCFYPILFLVARLTTANLNTLTTPDELQTVLTFVFFLTTIVFGLKLFRTARKIDEKAGKVFGPGGLSAVEAAGVGILYPGGHFVKKQVLVFVYLLTSLLSWYHHFHVVFDTTSEAFDALDKTTTTTSADPPFSLNVRQLLSPPIYGTEFFCPNSVSLPPKKQAAPGQKAAVKSPPRVVQLEENRGTRNKKKDYYEVPAMGVEAAAANAQQHLSKEYTGGGKSREETGAAAAQPPEEKPAYRKMLTFRVAESNNWLAMRNRIQDDEDRPSVGIVPTSSRVETTLHQIVPRMIASHGKAPLPGWIKSLASLLGSRAPESWSLLRGDLKELQDGYENNRNATQRIQLIYQYRDIEYDIRSNRWWDVHAHRVTGIELAQAAAEQIECGEQRWWGPYAEWGANSKLIFPWKDGSTTIIALIMWKLFFVSMRVGSEKQAERLERRQRFRERQEREAEMREKNKKKGNAQKTPPNSRRGGGGGRG